MNEANGHGSPGEAESVDQKQPCTEGPQPGQLQLPYGLGEENSFLFITIDWCGTNAHSPNNKSKSTPGMHHPTKELLNGDLDCVN